MHPSLSIGGRRPVVRWAVFDTDAISGALTAAKLRSEPTDAVTAVRQTTEYGRTSRPTGSVSRSRRSAPMMVLLGMVAACSTAPVPESQRADAVGIYKSSAINSGEWRHVATIHGWVDDMDVCIEIVEFLEEEEPGRYACRYVDTASRSTP